MSLAERKRTFESRSMRSAAGRHNPVLLGSEHRHRHRARKARAGDRRRLHRCPRAGTAFPAAQDETLYDYYRAISERVDIGIAMWSHPDSGYLMSPELCARIAEMPNIVAIKYSVPREMYARLTQLAGDKLIVSTASEEEWFDNIVELGWRLYLCSSPPYLFQTKLDRRMREYTDLASRAKYRSRQSRARQPRSGAQGVPPLAAAGEDPAHSKYWQELLGQVGGRCARRMLELTEAEKEATRRPSRAAGSSSTGAGSARHAA